MREQTKEKKMRITKSEIQKIGNKISKIYGVPEPIISSKKRLTQGGYKGYEVRTELPSYEGGTEFASAVNQADPNVIVENQSGCIYFIYEP